jgi:hypothetical protein
MREDGCSVVSVPGCRLIHHGLERDRIMRECGWDREYSKAIEYQIEITKLNSNKE